MVIEIKMSKEEDQNWKLLTFSRRKYVISYLCLNPGLILKLFFKWEKKSPTIIILVSVPGKIYH